MPSAVKPIGERALAASFGKTEKIGRTKDSTEGEKKLLLETILILTDMSPKHKLFALCRSLRIAAIPNKPLSFSSMNKKLSQQRYILYAHIKYPVFIQHFPFKELTAITHVFIIPMNTPERQLVGKRNRKEFK